MAARPPVIGVTGDYPENEPFRGVFTMTYVAAVERAGGTPLLLPAVDKEKTAARQLDAVDGVVFIGGKDVPANRQGLSNAPEIRPVSAQRDRYDHILMAELKKRDTPVLAICYGIQLLNVAYGGTLILDIPTHVPGACVHSAPGQPRVHTVEVLPETRLAHILGVTKLEVNSSHHQAVKEPAQGFIVSARAQDGLVEAIELPGYRFMIGVQWHPEVLIDQPAHLALFRSLVEAASGR